MANATANASRRCNLRHSLSLGIYISVPFCRTKCSFCNFASGVFSRARVRSLRRAGLLPTLLPPAQSLHEPRRHDSIASVDSIYLGGGTPSVLAPDQLERSSDASATTSMSTDPPRSPSSALPALSPTDANALLHCGVNRVSLGVQSFVDKECSSVGRLHTRATTLADIARLRCGGHRQHQHRPHRRTATPDRGELGLSRCSETLATGVPHVSVYMLEVDEDSRLGQRTARRRQPLPRALCPRRRPHRRPLSRSLRDAGEGRRAAVRNLQLRSRR